MLNVDRSREAILNFIRNPEDWDADTEVTLSDVLDFVDEEEIYDTNPFQQVTSLISDRLVYIAVPLSLMDFETTISPVTWEVGRSSVSDIMREFGEPHGDVASAEERALTYDLYVENVQETYPSPPAPYSVRDEADEDRPDQCNFPYTGIWPPEALQVVFFFKEGILARFEFTVGERLT